MADTNDRLMAWHLQINSSRHELALRLYMVVVLAHWAEHLAQAFQIYFLHWPISESRGLLGLPFPWLVKSESLHYFYAFFMLIGLFILRKGFMGRSYRWWTVSLWIQFWHHIEHFILQIQAVVGVNIFGAPVPTSLVQFFVPRVELHMFYNSVVFVPMIAAMYFHLFPSADERAHALCSCANPLA